jgi:hypothetical protein
MSLREGAFGKNYLTGVAVLEKMAVAAVPAIETDRISGEKTPHYCGNRHIGGSQEQVKVIGYQWLGKTGCFGFGKDASMPIDKIISVNIIFENFFAFDATANYVVKGSGCVYPCFFRHNNSL